MRPLKRSITAKLVLLFFFVGFVSVAIVGTYSFYSAKHALVRRSIDQLISVRAAKKQQVEYYFGEKIRDLEILSRRKDLQQLLMKFSHAEFPAGKEILPSVGEIISDYRDYGFSNLYLLTCRDTVVTALSLDYSPGKSPAPEVMLMLKKTWKRNASADSVLVGDLFLPGKGEQPVCFVSRRIIDDTGKHLGMIALEISSAGLNHIMLQNNEKIGLGRSGEAYIVGSDHLMRSSSRFIEKSVLQIQVNTGNVREALQKRTGANATTDYRNIPVFSAYEPLHIPGLNWVVLAEIDKAEALVPVSQLRNDILLFAVVISLFILAIARLILHMITNPLVKLKEAALRLGKGDYSRKVDVTSGDEIGSLAQSFNRMAEEIREERRQRISSAYDGQEMERQRFSRDLHDGLGQQLVASKLMLEGLEEQKQIDLPATFSDLRQVFTSLAEEIHQISSDLMPPGLTEFGLENALRNLCEEMRKRTRMEVEFYSHGFSGAEDNKTVIYLYRIVQEGINNIIKHAAATAFSLQLLKDETSLIVILEDNGKGFGWDPDAPPSGNGISNIRERAVLLNGTFSLESKPGEGTTLRIKIPLKK